MWRQEIILARRLMAPGNCRQPPCKLWCMSHFKVSQFFPQWGCTGSSQLSGTDSGDVCERNCSCRWPGAHRAPGAKLPAMEELLAVFQHAHPKRCIPDHIRQQLCWSHPLQHQHSCIQTSVQVCSTVLLHLSTPLFPVDIISSARPGGERKQPRNTTYVEGTVTHQVGNCPEKRYFNQKSNFRVRTISDSFQQFIENLNILSKFELRSFPWC